MPGAVCRNLLGLEGKESDLLRWRAMMMNVVVTDWTLACEDFFAVEHDAELLSGA